MRGTTSFSSQRLDTDWSVSHRLLLPERRSQLQTTSYVLIALSEIFASITGMEYAFTKAPKNMRSLVMAFFLFASAISAAIGEAFVREY